MKNIGMFKLVSGDVVLGRYDQEDLNKEEVIVDKPFQLMLDPTQGGVGLIPFEAIFTQVEPETHTFKTEHIMYKLDVHASFEDAYIKQTTGIEVNMPTIDVEVD